MQTSQVQVNVSGLSGHICSVSIRRLRTSNIKVVKDAVVEDAETRGEPLKFHDFRLILGGRMLGNAELVGDLAADRDVLHLSLIRRLPRVGEALQALVPRHQGSREDESNFVLGLGAEVLGNRDFAAEGVEIQGWLLRYLPQEFRGDRELVLSAVLRDGAALEHASLELRGDRQVVLATFRQGPISTKKALPHVSQELRGDREVMLAAVRQFAPGLEFASAELRGERRFVLAAIRWNAEAWRYASPELRADRSVVLAAARRDHEALRRVVSERLSGASRGQDELQAVQEELQVSAVLAGM